MQSEWSISIRRACAVILLDPKVYRYKPCRPDQAALEQRIREICQTRVRFGYGHITALPWAMIFPNGGRFPAPSEPSL